MESPELDVSHEIIKSQTVTLAEGTNRENLKYLTKKHKICDRADVAVKESSEAIPSIATEWVLLQLAWCVFASRFFHLSLQLGMLVNALN